MTHGNDPHLGPTQPHYEGRSHVLAVGPSSGASAPLPEDSTQALIEVLGSLTSEGGLDAVLARIVEAAARLADARYAALGVLRQHGEGEPLERFVVYGLSIEEIERIGPPPIGHGLIGELIARPRVMRLPELGAHPHSVGFPPGHPPMTSFLGSPIRAAGEVFGNLYLTEKRGAAEFTVEDERTISALAAAAGAAIANARLLAEATRRAEAERARAEIAQAALDGHDVRELLQLVVDQARRITGATHAGLMLPSGHEGELVIEVVSGGSELSLLGVVAGDRTAAAEVARTRRPLSLEAEEADPRRQRLVPGLAAAWVPLLAHEETVGVLGVFGPRGPHFRPETVATLESFAAQAALALLVGQAAEAREELAVAADRERIGRDLHDLVIQRIYATGLGLQAALASTVEPAVTELLEQSVTDLDETIREIRTTIFQLQATEADRAQLRARATAETETAGRSLGFRPSLSLAGPLDTDVPEALADAVVAALREALSNVARHAHATRVHVTLQVAHGEVTLVVVDDGVGIGGTSRRSGLANLAGRATALGGEATVDPVTAPGRGTRLVWRAPLTPPP
ncbi:MAG: sensor histidine kinase [Actinomycetales bacterium]